MRGPGFEASRDQELLLPEMPFPWWGEIYPKTELKSTASNNPFGTWLRLGPTQNNLNILASPLGILEMAKSGQEPRFPYFSLSEQKVSAVVIAALILDDSHQAEWPPEYLHAAKNLERL